MRESLYLDNTGWCVGATRIDSPNCDDRPAGTVPDLLVVHSISLPPGEFGGSEIIALFTNRLDWDAHPYFASIRGLMVSAHFLVGRDGSLMQFVSCDRRAWHAGASSFEGRSGCNDFSIGIELEGLDTAPFEAAQYETLVGLGRALLHRYQLVAAAAHSEIAPGRKTDPGRGFEWQRFLGPTQVPLRRIQSQAV
jgi:AmpD protein